jgi:heme-degrading monooxygenase HmoA
MKFIREQIPKFLEIFNQTQDLIQACSGCSEVKLFVDKRDPCVLFTISKWESLQDLEAYRQSDLFKTTWAQTKILFDDKAQAWSLEQVNYN